MAGQTNVSPIPSLKPVADNVWIFDDAPIAPLGIPVPIRMTVLRLSNGNILLHSPTRYTRATHDEIERLGAIRYLLAPNVAHWMFIADWQKAIPDAIVAAAPGLAKRRQVRKSDLRIDHRELRKPTRSPGVGAVREPTKADRYLRHLAGTRSTLTPEEDTNVGERERGGGRRR